MLSVKVGIIAGSNLNDPDIINNRREREVETPYGKTSDVLIEGDIAGVPCVFLARHGRMHTIIPSEVNYRANVWALREVGCTHILASTACGGLQEHTQPGDLVVLNQFFDRTSGRLQTLYDGKPGSPEGVLHMPMAYPFCAKTRKLLIEAGRGQMENTCDGSPAERLSAKHPCLHTVGSAVSINGPRFSTCLESTIMHNWGIDVINMTLVPEVVLAKEAGLCYASIAMVTDFDSWKPGAETVSVESVLAVFKKNAELVKRILIDTVKLVGANDWTETLKANKALIETSRQDIIHQKNTQN